MSELKWGILGCGVISEDFARAMKQCQHQNKVRSAIVVKNCEILGCCCRSKFQRKGSKFQSKMWLR